MISQAITTASISPNVPSAAAAPLARPSEYDEIWLRRLAASQATVECAAERFGDGLVLSTSFGIHAAVMLHLTTQVVPDVPVVFIDTGYLPAATHQFAAELSERLDLNLHVYRSPIAPARMEARHGRLWESEDVADLDLYDRIRKVEPMQRALRELGATAWLAGLRAEHTEHRSGLSRVGIQDGRAKILPILDWTTRNAFEYLKQHQLPLHPYFELGYATVGDEHSSGPALPGQGERQTRFRGLKEECGLHL
jgi:phosphoadenosine phosphosulfate reductase